MPRRPKKKCCLSTPRCARCPLRMLAEGTLPEGYAVQRRRLVKVAAGPDVEAGKGKGTKHKGTKHKGTKHKGTKHKGKSKSARGKGTKHKGKSKSARGKG